MKIYVSHSRSLDYLNLLYKPLKTIEDYEFIFPHENEQIPFDSKKLLRSKEVDLVLAEVSFPATGQGVELGWANAFNIPIKCIFKSGSKISSSLEILTNQFLEYKDLDDLQNKIKDFI